MLDTVSHEVQVAVNWAVSLWHETEVFIWAPVDGDFFALHPDDRMHDVSVRLSVHSPLPHQLLEVFLDGELIRSFSASNVSFVIPAVTVGSHTLSAMCGDAQATSVFVVQVHNLPVFIPQPPEVPATGFISLPPQSVALGHSGPSLRSISICILAFPGSNKHVALKHTLKSLRSSGLVPPAELLVFVQGLDDDLVDVAREYDALVLGFGRPIGKGNAWRHLALAASRPLVLLLEEDFSVVTLPDVALEVCYKLHAIFLTQLDPEYFVLSRLELEFPAYPSSAFGCGQHSSSRKLCPRYTAWRLCLQHVSKYTFSGVRLRSRRHPGEPLWSERCNPFLLLAKLLFFIFSRQKLHRRRGGSIESSSAHDSLCAHAAPEVWHVFFFLLPNHDGITTFMLVHACSSAHTSIYMFGGSIWVCYANPVHWCSSSHHADYTNNPMMYTRLWLLQHLGDQLAGMFCRLVNHDV